MINYPLQYAKRFCNWKVSNGMYAIWINKWALWTHHNPKVLFGMRSVYLLSRVHIYSIKNANCCQSDLPVAIMNDIFEHGF